MADGVRDHRSNFPRRLTRCALGTWTAILFVSGCTSQRAQVAQALGSGIKPPVIREQSVEESYRIGCRDVVEIVIAGQPRASGRFAVDAEGRIASEVLGNPRIEGLPASVVTHRVAVEIGAAPEEVTCKVVAYRSRVAYVRGPIEGGDRAVIYRGPENAVSFIRRCGGLTPAADIRDIHVVRGNVANGLPAQVFAVDLEAILLRGEPQTNVLIQPFDEMYIGERPRAKFGRALPHWLRPVYRGFCGVFPGVCPHDWRQQIRDVEP